MDKTLSDYDQSLEELERQREHLELVMEKMGQEWELSGPGIGWMGSVDLASNESLASTESLSHAIIPPTPAADVAPLQPVSEPFLNMMQPTPNGPSPEYIQTLLNANEAFLTQSLSVAAALSNSPKNTQEPTTCALLSSESFVLSPPITPDEPNAAPEETRGTHSSDDTTTASNH